MVPVTARMTLLKNVPLHSVQCLILSSFSLKHDWHVFMPGRVHVVVSVVVSMYLAAAAMVAGWLEDVMSVREVGCEGGARVFEIWVLHSPSDSCVFISVMSSVEITKKNVNHDRPIHGSSEICE
jgi:hypothetical protein